MEKLKELKELIMRQADVINDEIDKFVESQAYTGSPWLGELKNAAEATEKLTQAYISILGAEEWHRVDELYKKIDELASELAKYKRGETECGLLSQQSCGDY